MYAIRSYYEISCDPANLTGQITAVPGTATTADYTYDWHVTNLAGASVTPDAASNGEIISALDAQTYALRLTSLITECST